MTQDLRNSREPSAETGPAAGRHRLRMTLRALRAIGPVAAAFTAYGVLLDMPEAWFGVEALRYVVALLSAGVVGLGTHTLLRLPGVREYLGPQPPVELPIAESATVYDLAVLARRRLIASLRPVEERPALRGWSHFLDGDLAPSPVGTAYGLRLVLALDLQSADLNRRRLVEAMLAMQRRGGGWSARGQRSAARPEVTAWVLLTAVRAGLGSRDRARLVERLEELITDDPIGQESTAVVTAVMGALTEVAPDSPVLADLAPRLASAARDGRWGESMSSSVPSTPHTARAVIAMQRAADVLPDHAGLEASARAGREWLAGDVDLGPRHEVIRRPVGMDHDNITIDHFTSAWVARALLTGEDPPYPALRGAIRDVLSRQEDGIWTWAESQPIWMTYQGLAVLRDYSLRHLPWPP